MRNCAIPSYLPPASWSCRWWTPDDLLTEVSRFNEQVPQEDFFGRPELKQLREAYAAALFGSIRAQGSGWRIRLVADNFPDFVLQHETNFELFELTEADRHGRRRALEYHESARRRAAGIDPDVEHFDPDEEERAALPAIARAIERKAKKLYRPAPHLLVYVNFFLFWELRLTAMQALNLTEPWRDRFSSVWLLWGANAVRCWPSPAKIVARQIPTAIL